ncbi:porin [Burkholderia sp. MSMB1072]|uniref:porin n=1 Tax=unclassified Burkholderia TaxID=2613784 RepID=UPI00075937F3|nr:MULTISPECIES: porin [unclassified Burkholderia]KVD44957.1 porin [Burkholderia sp. ABCPW 11]KVH58818.1 porin [Burkholderia sp. MSMB1072]
MKKLALSTLSLALLGAAGAAQAQSSVTLYGVIDTSITYVHGNDGQGNNSWSMGSGNLQGSRFGLKGSEDLGGGLKAIFQLENGFNSASGALGQGGRMFGRQAFVGLQSDQYGTLTLGRQYDPLVDLVQAVTADNYFGSVFATPGDVDNNDNSLRVSNAIKYTSPVWAGLQVEAMYALGGVAGATGKGQTWAAAAAYNNGPLGLAAGYFHANNSAPLNATGQRTGWAGTSDAIFDGSGSFINNAYTSASSIGIAQVAGQYAFGPVTFGLGYSNAQYKADANSGFGTNQKYNTGRAFVTYQASAPLLLGVGYIYTKGSGQTDAKYHQVSLGADYSLSKRTDIYLVGAYQHASGHNADGSDAQASVGSYGIAGKSSQEIVALGLRHKF